MCFICIRLSQVKETQKDNILTLWFIETMGKTNKGKKNRMTEFELIIFTIKIQSKLKFYTIRKKQIQKKRRENQFSDNHYPGRFIIFY